MSIDQFHITLTPYHISWMIKIILSTLIGSIIGFEREKLKRPAGLRTHILVSIGSTLVTIANTQLVYDLSVTGMANVNPARYGAAVISGIGFLGAGTIIKSNGHIKGLTTAASIWGTACIGIVIGHGYYYMGIFSAITFLVVLEIFMRFEYLFHINNPHLYMDICIQNSEGVIGRIGHELNAMNIDIINISITHGDDNKNHILVHIQYNKRYNEQDILDKISKIDGVDMINKQI